MRIVLAPTLCASASQIMPNLELGCPLGARVISNSMFFTLFALSPLHTTPISNQLNQSLNSLNVEGLVSVWCWAASCQVFVWLLFLFTVFLLGGGRGETTETRSNNYPRPTPHSPRTRPPPARVLLWLFGGRLGPVGGCSGTVLEGLRLLPAPRLCASSCQILSSGVHLEPE